MGSQRVRHHLATQQQRNWGSVASCSGLRGRRAQPQGSTIESTEVVAIGPVPATACPLPPHSVTRTQLSSLWAKAWPSDPAACSARRGRQGQVTPRGSPHRPRSHLQPSDTALAGRLAGLESASRAGCPRTGWPWSQRPPNVFPVGLPGPEPLPLPTTVPVGPAWLPSTLAFKYIQNPLPRALWSPLPALNPRRRGHSSPPQSWTPFPPSGRAVFTASVCGISLAEETGLLATRRGLQKRWEGSDFHVIIHSYKGRCQVHTGNTAVVLFS